MRKLGAIHRPAPLTRVRAGGKLIGDYTPRAAVDYTKGFVFDGSNPLGNDQIGNCVECAFTQLARVRWKITSGDDFAPTGAFTTALYTQWTGYNPADPATDAGTDVLTALANWGSTGLNLRPNGRVLDIGPWFAVDPTDQRLVQAAVSYGIGALFTVLLRAGDDDADLWDLPPPGQAIIGSHEVACLQYDPVNPSVITWGQKMPCTWPGLMARLQAVAVPLSRLITNTLNTTPAGQSWDGALAALTETLGVSPDAATA